MPKLFGPPIVPLTWPRHPRRRTGCAGILGCTVTSLWRPGGDHGAGRPEQERGLADFADRRGPVFRDDICFFVSQSGETADTLQALEYAQSLGAMCLGITNGVSSTLARKTEAGARRPENCCRCLTGVMTAQRDVRARVCSQVGASVLVWTLPGARCDAGSDAGWSRCTVHSALRALPPVQGFTCTRGRRLAWRRQRRTRRRCSR